MNAAPDRIEIMATLWEAQKSITEIGAIIGLSRGAVAGLISRNRDKFELRGGKSRMVSVAARREQQRPTPKQPPKKPPAPRIIPPDLNWLNPGEANSHFNSTHRQLADVTPVPFFELKPRHCKFILSDEVSRNGPETMCCGADRQEGKPYCSAHCWIVYRRVAA